MASDVFPTEDVIQDMPVSLNNAVEDQPNLFRAPSKVTETVAEECPANYFSVEGPSIQVENERSSPFLLELFCGTAGVCAQFKTRGGRALGIDHHLKRTRLKAAAVKLDLTQPWVQELIEREVRLGRVHALHLGPPCGTASRARNIPVKRKLRCKGAPNPKPLRSSQFPLGFPWLKGLNKVKCDAANCLYAFAARLAKLADLSGTLVTIENPANSFMWETPFFKPLLSCFHFHVVDACEYGSMHKKATAFLANFVAPRLQRRCSGLHQHAPWTIKKTETGAWSFDTAKEAEYPTKLASELAASFLDELAKRGKWHLQDDLHDHATKIVAESQPRRTKGPLLVAEFKAKVDICCGASDAPPDFIPENALPPWQGIPVGAKHIDVQPVNDDENGGVGDRQKVTFGVYFSPEEFIINAQKLVHPFDVPLPLDEANMESIGFILQNGPAKVAQFRADKLRHYLRRAKELQCDERRLHDSLDRHIQPVLKAKRLLLFKEMIDDAGLKDQTLVDEMCSGFTLVGDLGCSGQFQSQFKPAMISVDQLQQTASWAQKAVVASCRRVLEDVEVARAVWDETLEQAADDKRWVIGPFSAEEISQRLGDKWVPSRRFGVRQNNKIRAVDDFSQFLVNSAATCHEKIDLEGIDSICATARFFLGAPSLDGSWKIPAEEAPCTGKLSPAWKGQHAADLYGRCLDLKHAYKQLARSPENGWASVLAVANPSDNQVYFFESVALPFGAISSVLAFNRVARALRTVLSKVFKLVVTIFFDDFCQIETGLLRNSAWTTAEAVMTLLGWKISLGDEKRLPFQKKFEILGAVVSLPEPGETTIYVSNKQSRIDQLATQVEELKSCLGRHAGRSKLESIKGRLLYASGHTYGKCTQLACQLLHKFGGSGPTALITADLVHAVSEALTTLMESKPRAIHAWSQCPPVLIFTDGAVEGDKVTHGAVFVDPWKCESFFFGDYVPEVFVGMWRRADKKQVIAQAEIFPVLVSKETWASKIDGRSVLWFLDNDSARLSLVRCFSPVLVNFCLLQLNARLDSQICARHWYSRVPSKSNPSDDASRLEFSGYRNASQCTPVYTEAMQAVSRFWKLMEKIEKGV